MTMIAFQGEKGAYSEEALYRYFDKEAQSVPCKSFSEVFQMLEDNKVDCAIVPVENCIQGSVVEVYDLLLKHDLKITGEIFHRIKHCLISFPENTIEFVKKVYSHPQAIGQSRKFLQEHNFETIPFYDTAGSIKMIKENNMKDSAGIASSMASEIYGMKVLESGIETNHKNYTRFLVLSKQETESTGSDKTTIIFTAKHEPGTLYRVLEIFFKDEINLTKIESRPILGTPWEYNFFVDFEGHVLDENVKKVLDKIKTNTSFMKIAGSYPRAEFTVCE